MRGVAFLVAALLPFGRADTTFLSFSRRIQTCDLMDRPLQETTSKMIWAYNSHDPETDNSILQHEERGIKSVRFFSEDTGPNNLPNDTQILDTVLSNQQIDFNAPNGDTKTQYWCSTYKIQNVFSTVRQIIRVEPVVQPENVNNVHHILLYQCANLTETDLAYQGGCYQQNTPTNIRQCNFGQLVASWAIGGVPFNYPAHIGLPVEGDTIYLLMETHYDNPNELDITDSSGLRMYHTAQKRQYDAGIMPLGYDIQDYFIIPPGQSAYTYNAYCPSECTQHNYPPSGINVSATMLHTHLAGKQAFFRIYRNGTELAPLLQEPFYDFNYQELSPLFPERTILPGDMLQVQCVYDTTQRTWNTTMGLSTSDEMCLAYVLYYPKLPANKELCIYGNYTGLVDSPFYVNQTIICGDTYVSNWQGPPPTTPYVTPECVYNPPPVNVTPPTLVQSLNKSFYTANATLDSKGLYRMYWTVDRENLLLHAAVEVETTGWVGLGISPNGMEGADVLIGWIKDGQVHFADRFAPVKAMPNVDSLQDFYDISGGEIVPTKSGLSRAAVVGIAAGGGVLGVLLLGLVLYFCIRSKKGSKMEYEAMPSDGYGGTTEGTERPHHGGGGERSGKEPVAL